MTDGNGGNTVLEKGRDEEMYEGGRSNTSSPFGKMRTAGLIALLPEMVKATN